MADRNGLQGVGLLFATITLAVVMTAAVVVKGHADSGYAIDKASTSAYAVIR